MKQKHKVISRKLRDKNIINCNSIIYKKFGLQIFSTKHFLDETILKQLRWGYHWKTNYPPIGHTILNIDNE